MAIFVNKQKILNPYILDIDIYDRKNYLGESLMYKDTDAVNNAIIAYMVNKKGSYLYEPNFGSPLDILEFKNLDIVLASNYAQRIANQVQANFNKYISDVAVVLTPDYNNRLIDIVLSYISKLSKDRVTTKIVKKANIYKYENAKNFIDVPFEGDQLIRFISLEVMNQPKSQLLFDPYIQSWTWAAYKFSKIGDVGTTSWNTVQQIIYEYNSKVV